MRVPGCAPTAGRNVVELVEHDGLRASHLAHLLEHKGRAARHNFTNAICRGKWGWTSAQISGMQCCHLLSGQQLMLLRTAQALPLLSVTEPSAQTPLSTPADCCKSAPMLLPKASCQEHSSHLQCSRCCCANDMMKSNSNRSVHVYL